MATPRAQALLTFGVGALTLLTSPLLPIRTATAWTGQCDPPGNFQTGFASASWPGSQPHSYEGASALMTYRYGDICIGDPTNNNTVSDWTMVHSNDRQGWAQSGFLYVYGAPCWRHFAEQMFGGQRTQVFGSCVGGNELHRVWQQVVYNNGWKIRSNIDTTVFIESTVSPFTYWNVPFQVSFDAEAHHDASNIPGSYQAPVAYTNMQVQDFIDDTWHGTCPWVYLGVVRAPRMGVDAPTCDFIHTWAG